MKALVLAVVALLAAGAMSACGGSTPAPPASGAAATPNYPSCAVRWETNSTVSLKNALAPCIGLGGKVVHPKRIDCAGPISDYTYPDGRTVPPVLVELYGGHYVIAYFDDIRSVELGDQVVNSHGLTNKRLYESVCADPS